MGNLMGCAYSLMDCAVWLSMKISSTAAAFGFLGTMMGRRHDSCALSVRHAFSPCPGLTVVSFQLSEMLGIRTPTLKEWPFIRETEAVHLTHIYESVPVL